MKSTHQKRTEALARRERDAERHESNLVREKESSAAFILANPREREWALESWKRTEFYLTQSTNRAKYDVANLRRKLGIEVSS